MTAIVAQGLSKNFAAQGVLNELDLTVPVGSIYGLLGRNGAGKTTLMKLAMGFLLPTGGEIHVLGKNPGTAPARDKGGVGYVAEESLLPGWMRIRDVLRFEISARPKLNATRVEEYRKRAHLDDKRVISTLSKGQRKRIELELALAAEAPLLILDEPFDGLDPISRAEAMEAIVAHAGGTGATVLVSSHILTDIERMCDRIGVLAHGRIAFESDLDLLKESVSLVFGAHVGGGGGGGGDASAGGLPIKTDIIAKRSDGRGNTWLARGLQPEQETDLRRRGFQLSRPGLDELGVELISGFDAMEERR